MKMSGADALLKALEQEGVEVIFAYPGGASMPIHDALGVRDKIRTILRGTSRAGLPPRVTPASPASPAS